MKPTYVSSIPERATPAITARHPNGAPRRVVYTVEGALVGVRTWSPEGHPELETPLLEGRKHGIEYAWYTADRLTSAEPFRDGLAHGTAQQWAEDGRLLGTSTMQDGTGIDLWRDLRADGSVYLAEVRYLENGRLHGPEWWINEDQASVFIERHWQAGTLHGPERVWASDGSLDDDYPKFWVEGREVSRETYRKHQAGNPTLPPLRSGDDRPIREFPPEIQPALRP